MRVTVASDYAAVIEALRNRTADLAFVHPGGYVLASREAKATIVVRNLWHGKSSFTSRIFVRKDSGIKSVEELRGAHDRLRGPGLLVGLHLSDGPAHPEGSREEPRPQDLLQGGRVLRAPTTRACARCSTATSTPSPRSTSPASNTCKDPAERERHRLRRRDAGDPEAGIAARPGLDPAVFAKVRAALLQIRAPEYADLLKRLYEIDGFAPAEDRDYDPVRAAIELLGARPR